MEETKQVDLKAIRRRLGLTQMELAEFTFDYRFSGTRRGEVIDFFVFTWVIDSDENIFVRYCSYNPDGWKKVIKDQIKRPNGRYQYWRGIH